MWNPDSTVTVLEGPSGWVDAVDINDAGVVVGHAGIQPVKWVDAGPPQELGHVIELGWVHAINAAGAICGASDEPGDQAYTEAVVWEPDGAFRPLGVWSNAGSDAHDINDSGEVVGWIGTILYAPPTAVHWDAAGTITDLSEHAPPGWELLSATAINNRGDIAGQARDSQGVRQAYVLWKTDPTAVETAAPHDPRALRIFPNPSPGTLSLRLPRIDETPTRIRLLDVTGRQVRSWDLAQSLGGAPPSSESGGWSWSAGKRLDLPRGRYNLLVEFPSGRTMGGGIVLLSRP